MPDKDADELEKKLKISPNDLSVRAKLLGYYVREQFKSDTARKLHQEHIFWIIQNCPETEIAGNPECLLLSIFDGEAYDKAKVLWLRQVETNKENTKVLGNAANFFLLNDKDIAEDLLKKAQILDLKNPEWSKKLAHLYELGLRNMSVEARKNAAVKSLEQLENALKLTVEDEHRFYMLGNLAKIAFEAGDLEKAKSYASELLSKAPEYRNDWNYGNAIHYGNLVLGRIALKSGQVRKAKKYLIKSGQTPGSPGLNISGPAMILAKELLEKDEKKVVIKYFELCSKFWKMQGDQLKIWTAIVNEGKIPDFSAHLDY